MKSFAVIGLGLFGSQLAKELYSAGCTVLAIDIKEENVEAVADYVSDAVTLDAKNRAALSRLGINNYDCAIVALTGDLATSVLITMNLKALKVPEIICKIHNDTDREVLEALGANSCIIPENIAVTKLTKKLTSRNILDYTQLSDDHSIIEMMPPSAWVGESIVDLKLRTKYKINIIAIRRDNEVRVDFDPYLPLDNLDELIIIGKNRNLDVLQKLR